MINYWLGAITVVLVWAYCATATLIPDTPCKWWQGIGYGVLSLGYFVMLLIILGQNTQ